MGMNSLEWDTNGLEAQGDEIRGGVAARVQGVAQGVRFARATGESYSFLISSPPLQVGLQSTRAGCFLPMSIPLVLNRRKGEAHEPS
jgi:hypothetical protein